MNRSWQRFKKSYLLYSFKQDWVAIASFIVLVSLILISITAPFIAPYNPYDPLSIDIMNSEIPPAWIEEGTKAFIFGTDIQGRDLLSK